MTATDATTETSIRRRPREVVGPRFGLVELLKMRRHPVAQGESLRARYGETYRMRIWGIDLYVANGPDAFDAMFVNRDKIFASGPAWSYFIGPFFHRGLMLLDFEEHLYHRRIMQSAFGADQLKRYHEMMVPFIRESVAGWGDVADPHFHRMFRDLTLDVALEVFVGTSLPDDEHARFHKAFMDSIRAGTAVVRRDLPFGIGPWSRGLAGRKVLEEFFYGLLPAKRREGGDDLFGQLCTAVDDDGNTFTDQQIVDHMIFLLMAAHDTTTTTMTSMAFQLAKHPEWQERCRAEARAVTEPSYEAENAMVDLDLVMKESLRLCAPVPNIPRTATRETELNGYRIPAGAYVMGSPYGNHFRPEIWPDPHRFDPERFSDERREDKAHRQAFQAFGAGVHKCIGMYFAGMQMRAVFRELLSHYEWSVPDGYEMPIDLAALPVPRDGLPVSLRRI